MRVLMLIFLFSGQLLVSCEQNKDLGKGKVEIKTVTHYSEEDDIEGPPPDYKSRFNSLKEWLHNICDNEPPESPIADYNFGLIESQGQFIVYLVGTNTYETDEFHSVTRNEFEPADMYFLLPDAEFTGMTRLKAQERLTAQLKNFVYSDKFRSSFLAKAVSVKAAFSGEVLFGSPH